MISDSTFSVNTNVFVTLTHNVFTKKVVVNIVFDRNQIIVFTINDIKDIVFRIRRVVVRDNTTLVFMEILRV